MNRFPSSLGVAFREKIAWLSLVCMIGAYAVYFSLATAALRRGADAPRLIGYLAAVLAIQAVVAIIASITIAMLSGAEARAAADERDRAIARRGAAAAYFVLMVGMILVGCVMPFSDHGWQIINAALFAPLAAEG